MLHNPALLSQMNLSHFVCKYVILLNCSVEQLLLDMCVYANCACLWLFTLNASDIWVHTHTHTLTYHIIIFAMCFVWNAHTCRKRKFFRFRGCMLHGMAGMWRKMHHCFETGPYTQVCMQKYTQVFPENTITQTNTIIAWTDTQKTWTCSLTTIHYLGKYQPGVDKPDPKTWKANFRCAMNSLPDIEEVKDKSIKKGTNAFRVYKMLSASERQSKRGWYLSQTPTQMHIHRVYYADG